MAEREEIEADTYSGNGLGNDGVNDVLDCSNEDYGPKDMGSLYHTRYFTGELGEERLAWQMLTRSSLQASNRSRRSIAICLGFSIRIRQ